jgi:DNA polymerase III delta prime subunit
VEIKFLEHSAISSMLREKNDIILVESQAFFPAYFHTLESIKNIHGLVSTKKSKLPFGEQLVSLCINIEQPEYLHSTSCKEGFDFSCFGSGLGTIDISREQNWPKASTLSLDDSQYGAFVTAMKSKLALIQGPPGTGKTVVGLKIAELLLNNIHIWRNENEEKDGPFLLISYTNHALDQFLLEITKRVPGLKEKDVVRLGSRSEVEELTRHNLSVLRKDRYSYKKVDITIGRRRYRRVVTRTIREVTNEYNVIAFDSKMNLNIRIQDHEKLRKMETELLSGIVHEDWFYCVSGVMNEQHYNGLQEPWTIIKWLNAIDLLQENVWTSEQTSNDNAIYDGEEFDLFEMDENTGDDGDDDSENYDNHFTTRQEYMHLDFDLLHMAVSSSTVFSNDTNDGSHHFWDMYTNEHRRLFMQKLHDKIKNTTAMSNEEVRDVFNIHQLSSEGRWKLYKYWLTKSLAPLQKEIQEREKRYGKAQEHYKNVQQVADIKILKRAKIIACTTSRAARDIEILKRVSPKIILLEEAAEIP